MCPRDFLFSGRPHFSLGECLFCAEIGIVRYFHTVGLIATLSLVLPSMAADEQPAPIVAIYDIEEIISETGRLGPDGLLHFDSDTNRPLTHFDIVRSLHAAAEDENVKGVALDLGDAGLSLAQAQEMRRSLLALRKQGKDVWFYTESLSLGSCLIGSAANHFTLLPEGDVFLIGMYSESMYFKELLDKIGVSVEVIHIGDFKNAGEMFYRTGPSAYARQQQETLFDSIYGQVTQQISDGRKISRETLLSIIDKGIITPEQAKSAGLVDALQYRTDFNATLRKHYGEKTEFDHSYELPDLDGPQIAGLMDLMKLVFNSGKDKKFKEDFVAVVAMEGIIDDASVAPVRSEILKLAKNDQCKALVLRVNSPGGSALSSDVLWEATDEFKATQKPLVVSMGAVAASGGYYISAGAEKIFAEEGTITGSIGVVGMKPVLGGGMEKLGIQTHSIQRGKNAGMMSIQRGFTDKEAEIVRKSMQDVYATFKKRILDGRGKRIKGDLEKHAGGRVYSGKDALTIGLVDEIGGLNEAIAHAAALAKLETYEAHLIPEPKSPFENIFSDHSDKRDDDGELIRMTRPGKSTGHIEQHLLSFPGLRLLNAGQRSQLLALVRCISSYQKHPVLLIGPAIQAPQLQP